MKKKMHIIILGDGAVGKTSILKQYANQKFTSAHIKTIGIDCIQSKFIKDDQEVECKIWDTAG